MHNLLPFTPIDPTYSVQAEIIFREENLIQLDFSWSPRVETINSKPTRQHELWKRTCFEAFIQPYGKKTYWEINLSADGNWNVYQFDEYRTPLPLREDSSWKLINFQNYGNQLEAQFQVDFQNNKKFNIGLTCILDLPNGEQTYWALTHCKQKPDFHDSNTFVLERKIP